MTTTNINRRQFLAGAAGTGGLAAAGSVLSACGGSGSDAAKPRKAVAAPVHVPYGAIKPDLPAAAGGVPAGYFRYPAKPADFITEPPGDGGEIGLMLEAQTISKETKNLWWQALNKELNVDLKFQITPSADYLPKFQVAVAGNDFPDIVQINQVRDMPQVLDRQFADLSEHLSGDAIKKYPGLASIPQEAWQISTVNGRIWGIPQYRATAGLIVSFRGDVAKKIGVDTPVAGSGKEFLDICKEVTSTTEHRWAFGTSPTNFILPFVLEMMEAPNVWSEDGGKFTSVNESPQMKDALDVVAKMWKRGYIHPDSIASPGNNYTWWQGGTTVFYPQSFAGWSSYQTSYPNWRLGVLAAPKWDGGGLASKALGLPGYPDYAAFKKASASRVKLLLEICNYLAAPFGTQEYLTMNYGVAGHDYNEKNGNLTPTPTATSEYMPISYVGAQRYSSLYMPNDPATVRAQHEYLSKVLPTGVRNAAQGLYSETNLTKGASANEDLIDVQEAIIQGRKPVSAWDDGLKTWRSNAGEKIRSEYEAAYAKVN